jgi:type 1 glutamine amidotransferase
MNRRELLARTGAAAVALGLTRFPFGWAAAEGESRKRILMFTRSQGYQHDVVKRKNPGELSLAEQIITDLGAKHGFDVKCEKDGRVFVNEDLGKYDAFLFETQGDLGAERSVDGQPAVPPEGKKALLKAIADGKGFVGSHCASDTYHSPGDRGHNQSRNKLDPYIVMVGGEFIKHGAQQKARMHVVDHHFPGAQHLKDFDLLEEWYALKNFAPDLHVILVQETEGMRGAEYQRPAFPATWAHPYEKGRVFYTSMGHRDDVWKNPIFQNLVLGGLSWALRRVDADITPNLEQAAPKASELTQKTGG